MFCFVTSLYLCSCNCSAVVIACRSKSYVCFDVFDSITVVGTVRTDSTAAVEIMLKLVAVLTTAVGVSLITFYT